MGSKYVIEIDRSFDLPSGTYHLVKGFKTLILDEYAISKLRPLKSVLDEEYNKGLADGSMMRSEELNRLYQEKDEAYNRGFAAGVGEGEKTANIVSETVSLDQKAYDAGLAVAWGVAATLATEYSINDVKEIFDISDYDEIYNLKVQDVIQKLYDYKSAKDKNVLTNKEKLLEIFGDNGLDFAAWWDNLWLEAEYKEPESRK